MRANSIKTFAVATLQEAVALREAGTMEEIIMLGLTPDMYADTIVKYNITPMVNSFENAKVIGECAKRQKKEVEGLIAVDTGMGRIGYLTDDDEAAEEIYQITQLEGFSVKGLFSHMATADEADKTFSYFQEQRYREFAEKLKMRQIEIPIKTLANSASIMELPTAYFDAVRPGIIL